MSNGIDNVSASQYSLQSLYASTTSPYETDQLPANSLTDPNGAFANLDLSTDQQNQISQLLAQNSSNDPQSPTQLFQKVESVLTPQQQQTLKNDLETAGKHHHHHHKAAATDASNPVSQPDLSADQQAYTTSGSSTSGAATSGSSTRRDTSRRLPAASASAPSSSTSWTVRSHCAASCWVWL